MSISFRILGPVAVIPRGHAEIGGTSLGPPKARGLLSTLLLAAGHIVSLEAISASLWDGEPPRSALANIRTYTSQLRTAVNRDGIERLHGVAQGYALRLERGDEFDLECFRSRAQRGRLALARGDSEDAVELFTSALSCWHGPAGADLSTVGSIAHRLHALQEERLTVIEDCVEARLRLGALARLHDEMRSLTLEFPLRERLWAALMRVRYQLGDVSGALDAYREAYAALRDELGVEPGSELVELYLAMLNREVRLEPLKRPAEPGGHAGHARAVPRELPPAFGRLAGRDTQITAVQRVVVQSLDSTASACDCPCVVVLHGSRGAGTSTLAHHIAAGLRDQFPDGQLYVDIAAVSASVEPADLSLHVLTRMLRSLDVPLSLPPLEADDAAARYRTAVATSRLLVVLDNVTDARQIQRLIPAGKLCAVLVAGSEDLAGLDWATHLQRVEPLRPAPPRPAPVVHPASVHPAPEHADPAGWPRRTLHVSDVYPRLIRSRGGLGEA
ncbi:AfsR/SARP family transcriptional regulator [Actinospica robiniae]|uniref:AfsR/SARP family transcriptional regulator n=1 Tax=Actinospica robiniae TaxID=304901 RepID=UPI0003FF9ED5|nr:AfsR/SARP family transcriptional regulator [Actinospica robiniae]